MSAAPTVPVPVPVPVPVDDEVLDVEGAARFLKVGPKAIRNLVRLGSIPHRVINTRGSARFSKNALAAWLAGKQK